MEREIRDLAIGLQSVKDEQEYIVVREKVHRNTAESTNDRVKWWSIVQGIVLFLVCGWQIYYLRVRASPSETRFISNPPDSLCSNQNANSRTIFLITPRKLVVLTPS